MTSKELMALSAEELTAKLASEKEALYKLKLAHAISPLENPMRIRENKKLVARILTSLTAKQLVK
jgi:large subunit ribosomal protein L29